jgi:hypothetical protein
MSFDILRKFRSLATLAVLAVLLLIGVSWGWSAVTAPLPKTVDPPICENVTVAQGEKVYPDQVTVSVLNAGNKEGLAFSTMEALVGKGFVQGHRANAPKESGVARAEIWTDDPDSAAVALVASYLAKNGKGVAIKEQDTTEIGINVVVGDRFSDVVKGRKSLAARADTTVCSPPATED